MGEPPTFRPQPQILCTDRKVCRASIIMKRLTTVSKSQRYKVPKARTMMVRYVCLKAGVSNVMVTLHVLAHRPTDFSWVKHCEAPKVKVGKALTAPQALFVLYILLALIGGAICCCCIFR